MRDIMQLFSVDATMFHSIDKTTLLCEMTINFIGKCFVFVFHPHLRIKSKASAYMSRHLHIKSKTSAYTIGTCFKLYMQLPLDI
jgi:hypothetical protein